MLNFVFVKNSQNNIFELILMCLPLMASFSPHLLNINQLYLLILFFLFALQFNCNPFSSASLLEQERSDVNSQEDPDNLAYLSLAFK